MKKTPHFWRIWLPVVVVGWGVVVFGWVAVQQSMRLSANDPQWQLAEDAANRLATGANPAAVIPVAVDETISLSPFVTVTDRNLKVLASSGVANSQVPLPPSGSFKQAATAGSNWFTWQHNGGVRDAAVIIPYGGTNPGYVLAARSLKQVEMNESHIQYLALATLAGVLAAPAILLLVIP